MIQNETNIIQIVMFLFPALWCTLPIRLREVSGQRMRKAAAKSLKIHYARKALRAAKP